MEKVHSQTCLFLRIDDHIQTHLVCSRHVNMNEVKGPVISYMEGGGGHKMGKVWIQNCLRSSPTPFSR